MMPSMLCRQLSSLSALIFGFNGVPGMIGLNGGLPNASIFPVKSMQLTLTDGTVLDISDPDKMAAAQQYNTAGAGYGPLHKWVTQHTQELHQPPAGQRCVITSGSNQAIDMVLCVLLNRGDSLLCDKYTYSHLVEAMVGPKGYKAIPVPTDDEGMTPETLEQTLQVIKAAGGKLPRVLYTVPTGQNPTSVITSLERKKALYQMACKHDLVIIEDDPYHYLQFPLNSDELGLHKLGQSYLSLDTAGRVVRLDSFAKFLAPGYRVGWLTAAEHFTEKFTYQIHGTALGPCSTTQVMIAVMMQHWGNVGLDKHLKDIQGQYRRRAGLMHTAAQKHLRGLAEWKAPGRISHCNGPYPGIPCPYVRISFAMAPEEDIPEGIRRLAEILKRRQ
eukprot:jgi/Astpho2/3670/fgenesh1_pg.00059_%23_23_t